MQSFGIVVIGVLVVGVVLGLYAARNPPRWDELGGESPVPLDGAPTTADDEAQLRALVAAKRARRLAEGGPAVASDARATEPREPWAHLDAEVIQEARALVARRRARLEREGREAPAEQSELERLLGPPTP
ncbi:MAG: hypothetical protein AAGC46_09660 [Solirubrobacteraceae bacterium]|nr:hypothetical protein [Patulibacter sp.]